MSRSGDVAIIGMAARVPGSGGVAELWAQILDGACWITDFPPVPGEVGARGVLADVDRFDAALFGYAEAEAAALDPQHRTFLELCWHALEDAGIDPFRSTATISVFASSSPSLTPLPPAGGSLSERYQAEIASSVDLLAGRVSNRLDLKGESVVVQTACSSSLVAVHMACQSLVTGRSEVALAGGISISPDQTSGYRYEEGMILSPDGRCRPFDRESAGTVPASGGGVVVLKSAQAAIEDGHVIYAIIRGSAVNNDGRTKASFMAPSVRGQVSVISDALAAADVDPATIGLIEAHGTATPLGDEVEVEALRRVFGAGGGHGATALGSIKGNAGHLDRAAGIAGLIKATLALAHKTIPPACGSVAAKPELGLDTSPFFLPQAAEEWAASDHPKRAGVSSFGVGGTNAHVVLEEAPPQPEPTRAAVEPVVVTLSAATQASLATIRSDLASFLRRSSGMDPAGVARSRNLGRAELPFRCAAVGDGIVALAAALDAALPVEAGRRRSLVYAFPGHGTRLLRARASTSPVLGPLREALEDCAASLQPLLGLDVRDLLYGESNERLALMGFAQPAVFTLEYGLAQLWAAWGVEPDLMLGHSMGEIVAATLAGVFELPDALAFVTERGRLLDESGAGLMLAVALPEEELMELLPPGLDLAAINGPFTSIVSGPEAAVGAFETSLAARSVHTRRLELSCAAHSRLMDPFLDRLAETLDGLALRHPTRPVVSGETGLLARPDDIVTTDYWVRHFRRPVRFADAVATAARDDVVILEVGPGSVLTRLAEHQLDAGGRHTAVPAFPGGADELESALRGLGDAWSAGVDVDWKRVHARDGARDHARLPPYPFDHTRSWSPPTPPASLEGSGRRGMEAPLVEPSDGGGAAPESAEPAWDEARIAQRLLDVWGELVGHSVGVDDNFFELGGDSLLALRMLAQLRREGLEVPLRTFWAAPTVSSLARLMAAEAVPSASEAAQLAESADYV